MPENRQARRAAKARSRLKGVYRMNVVHIPEEGMTEREAYEAMKDLPGFDLDEDGWSYTVQGPDGLHRIEGVRLNDEILEHERFGWLNVSHAKRLVDGAAAQTLPISDGLKRNLANRPVDPGRASGMSLAKRDTPILMIMGSDGVHVIDGGHRVRRRQSDGLTTVDAYLLRAEALPELRVRRYCRGSTGRWESRDTVSDRAFDIEVNGAVQFAKRMAHAHQ